RSLADLDTVIDAVSWNRLARDFSPSVGGVMGKVAVELGIGRFACPLDRVERFAVRPAPGLRRIARAARSGPGLGKVADVRRGHLVLAHLDPRRLLWWSDRRFGWNDDRRRFGHGPARATRSGLGSDGLGLLG